MVQPALIVQSRGRARGFQSMVAAGMDVAKAASIAGLLVQD